MLLKGRRVSRWWLLLVIPLLIMGAPFVLIAFFAANHFGWGYWLSSCDLEPNVANAI